jgi:purine-nucleoside phosphorylase
MSQITPDPYLLAEAASEALRARSAVDSYDVAVVLGSGWAEAATALGTPSSDVPTTDLPGFSEPSVPGHSGHVLSLALGGLNVALFTGRIHLYEGYTPHQIVHAVRTAVFAGAHTVVLTNACGARHPGYEIGEPVLISDHLNLMNASPLEGPPPPSHLASRFVDLADLYSSTLRDKISKAVPGIKEGVYAAFRGPHFETPAEITMAKVLGADLVGMSTALEAIAAKHLGAQVVGLSLVTDLVGVNSTISHEEVMAAAARAVPRLQTLLSNVVPLV